MQAAPVRPRVEKPDREPWIDEEWAGTGLRDTHLDKRLRKVLGPMSDGMGQSLPRACQDWANTKAAYRFFANDRVTEAGILRGHFESTAQRAGSVAGPLLVLHDTTEFSYKRAATCALGLLHRRPRRQYGSTLPKERTQKGILMHSSLVVNRQVLPLGSAAIKFWTREKFKGANALKRKINPTRIPIAQKESIKWLENLRQATALIERPEECVHIGDRESDIFELFCLAEEVQTKFLLRTALTGWRRTVRPLWPPSSAGPRCAGFTGWNSGTNKGKLSRRNWPSSLSRWWLSRPLANSVNTRN